MTLVSMVSTSSLFRRATLRHHRSISTSNVLNERKRDPGLDITGLASFPKEVPGPKGLLSREEQIRKLSSTSLTSPYDVLVIGGGATGK